MLRNRQWLLRSRPGGRVTADQFGYCEVELPEPLLQPGQILVRNLMFAPAPTQRNWMNAPGRSYRAAIEVGSPIRGPAVAEIIQSAHPLWPVGTKLTAVSGWEDYSVLEPDTATTPVIPVPRPMALIDALGVYGLNSLTAYFGLLRVGEPKPGETVVVSAAAGSVGSVAAQIARIHGCRVIGIAGGAVKCDWLRSACGLDAAIDHRSENVRGRLAQLCPNGVNVFFDNVGGEILQAVLDNMAVHGRIAVCGQVSAYDGEATAPGPRDMMRVVYWRVRIQGFVLPDFREEIESARADLERWVRAGQLVHRLDLRHGFERLPGSFLDLFQGANAGTLLVQIADPLCTAVNS
jgi:NADPH-dependent curcumin reductase CurA